jgi:ArsR family transcriptional regulator
MTYTRLPASEQTMKDFLNTLAELFKAFGDPTRLNVLRLLALNPERQLCVGAIACRLGVTQPAVSQHLKVLKLLGLVKSSRNGYRIHYSINQDMLATYKANIDELFTVVLTEQSPYSDCEHPDE